jgi:hypothetical protein
MPTRGKVLLGPQDTDFGIARLVELPDGTGRIEVFDEAAKVWMPSSNPKLTVGEMFDAPPVSLDLAARLGLADPVTEVVSGLPPAPPLSPDHKGPTGPERKRIGDQLVQAFISNLNYNVLHDIDPDAPEAERQAAYAKLRNEEFGWLDLPRVVRPETVAAIEKSLSLRGWQIADRWAAGAPAMVKRLEAEGTLLARLKEQADLEAEVIADARIGGRFQDVPDSELLAMNEMPALPTD